MPSRSVFFDFDGIIVDSNQLKFDAFFDILPADDERLHRAMDDVLFTHREKSRYEILERTFTACGVGKDDIDRTVEHYAKAYNDCIQRQILSRGLNPGVQELLKEISHDADLYIITGTPEEQVQETIDGLEIRNFFKGCYGSPRKKTDVINLILLENGYDRERACMVGDGESDMLAAQSCNIPFFGLANQFNKWQPGVISEREVIVDSLSDLFLKVSSNIRQI